ncbi:MAG TPA: hypothetical protein VFJ63_03725 [Candidatus Bathyarchaeia archaeon]|nr:hypothetical protein [Candidatus Bathyarchaeia archaeon]
MDQPSRRLLGDVLSLLVILLITTLAFWRYNFPGVLLAGGLAITVFVAADIVLLRRS